MTLHAARRKAARLTRAGVPTMVVRNNDRVGGYQTKTISSRRAAASKYNRKARYGASPEDVERLLREQTGPDGVARCPLTLMPVTAKSSLDHAHGQKGPDALRGILRPHVNGVVGGSDEELFQFTYRVGRYARKRSGLLVRRACSRQR
jgi:hypothetical protein